MNQKVASAMLAGLLAVLAVLSGIIPGLTATVLSVVAQGAAWVSAAAASGSAWFMRNQGNAAAAWGFVFLLALLVGAVAVWRAWESLGLVGQIFVIGVPASFLVWSLARGSE